jgi:hypothetical protein
MDPNHPKKDSIDVEKADDLESFYEFDEMRKFTSVRLKAEQIQLVIILYSIVSVS